ncbi:hypothetical protein G4B88_023203 [Cannabis sativa]|uniref:Disease resistance N-terminal domain-containing protein n=1 Tax=Cannabis sativa TaxID=3483 RepID=A0A7J6EH17_CANSA|nr:hypothetical protein G4B88_023203 [Cannabis sativa]
MDLFPNLKTLSIGNNHYFEALSMSDGKSLEELTYLLIEHCGSFVSFPNGGLIAPKLSEFVIRNCSKLKWLPKKMTSLSALNEFEVIGCPLMEPFPEEGSRDKTSLPDEPEIYGRDTDTDALEKKTHRLGCVKELYFKIASGHFGAAHSLYDAIKPGNPCSTSTSSGCLPFSTLTPLCHYPPLQELLLVKCGPSFRSLHMDLFPNLKTLKIEFSCHFEAISVSDGKSLEELTYLRIGGCGSFVSFPNGGLIAPKLNELDIVFCPKLKWLPENMNSLSSLKSLTIKYCPLIEPLPEGEGGLPIASPYVEKLLFNGENRSSVKERLFKLKSTFNTLVAVRFEVENKRIKNPAVEDWLDNLLDAVDDAEDFFGDIEYDAMKPSKVDESKEEKRKAISKFLSCFSKPSTSTDRVRNEDMEQILKRLEYLANQIGNLNLEKNVVEVQLSGSSRAKTSLPDEPEIYVSFSFLQPNKRGKSYFVMHDLFVDLARTITGKYSCLLEQNDSIDKLEKKTRHLGCDRELYTDDKIASYGFGATHLRTFLLFLDSSIKQYPLLSLPIMPCVTKMIIKNLENLESLYEAIKPRNPCSTLTPLQSLRLWDCGSSIRSLDMDLFPNLKTLEIYSSDYIEAITVSDGKSLEELTFLSIRNCGSFVSFPNGELIAPKLSVLEIFNCPKLKWLPEKMTSLSSLESLTIKYCPLIKSFPDGGLPVSLSSLDMSYDNKLGKRSLMDMSPSSLLFLWTSKIVFYVNKNAKLSAHCLSKTGTAHKSFIMLLNLQFNFPSSIPLHFEMVPRSRLTVSQASQRWDTCR